MLVLGAVLGLRPQARPVRGGGAAQASAARGASSEDPQEVPDAEAGRAAEQRARSSTRVLGRMGRLTAPLQRDITQAGMQHDGRDVAACRAACLALSAYCVVKSRHVQHAARRWPPACSLSFVPFMYVSYKKNQRLRKFEEQFPEAIDLIARALRAGHAFTTGLAMAAEEIPKPVGEEFKLLYDRQNFGMPLPEAMRAFAARIPLIDARFFVTAVLTQRETGGNLGEVLDNLAIGDPRAVQGQAAGARADRARANHRLDPRRHCRRRWRPRCS